MTDTDVQALIEQAQELLDDEEYEEALALLEGRDELDLRLIRVEARMELEEFEDAQDDLHEFDFDFDNPGDDPRPWTLKGFLHYYLDETEVGQEAFTQALTIDPQHIRALLGRALLFRDNMEYERAASLDVDRALMLLDGDDLDDDQRELKGEAYNLRAGFALEDGDIRQAEADLRAAIEVYDEDPEYHLDLARLLSLKGDAEGAIASAEQAVELDDLLIEGHLLISQLYSLQGKADLALAKVKATLDIDPEEPFSYLQLAAIQTLAGNFEAAIEAADQAQALDPDLVDSYQLKAAALQSLGRQAEITADMQPFLNEPPDLPDFLYGDRIDPYDQAREALGEMADLDQDELQSMVQDMFSQLGLPEALRPMVEQMMQNLPALMAQYPELAQGQLPPGMGGMLSGMGLDPATLAQQLGPGKPSSDD